MQPSKETVRSNITTWPELGINYWGINKNATSTFITHFSNILFNNAFINDIDIGQKAKQQIKKRYISPEQAFTNGLKNFGIVRNPYKRFESCYKHFAYPISPEQEKSSRKAKFIPGWSPDMFLQHINKKFSINDKAGNKHFWKQSTFITHPEKMDFIVKLEEIENNWPLDIPLPSFSANKTTSNNIDNYNKDMVRKLYQEDFINFGY